MSSLSERRKILFVLDKSGFGGVQTIARSLVDAPFSGSSISFFFLRDINTECGVERLTQPHVIYSKHRGKYSLWPFLELIQLIQREGFDVVHLNGTKSIIAGVFVRLLFRQVRVVSHDHSSEFDYKPFYQWLMRIFARYYDRVLCVSDRRKNDLTKGCNIPSKKISVLNNFVDENRFARRLRDEVPASDFSKERPFVIGYVGRLSHVKGADILLRAIPEVVRNVGHIKVLIAGDGPKRSSLQELAESLGVGQAVDFLGYVAEPNHVYADMDVMVIPSRSEEGPISLFESWLVGVPVVASDAPVINQRIVDGQTGLLFESENPGQLAKKIVSVWRDVDLRSRLVAGGSAAVEPLTLKNYVKRLNEIYTSL